MRFLETSLEVTEKLTFQTRKTDQIQTIYYFKPFKDENPKRTRIKIFKRALSAKTHFFLKNSISLILFEKQTILKTYELRFTEDEFLKLFWHN